MELLVNSAQVFATCIAAIGLLLSWLEMRRLRKENRLGQIERLMERLSQPALRDIYHEVERGEFQFPFVNPDKEKQIDRLLGEFEFVANLYKNGLITLQEVEIFAYQFLVVYQNPGIQEYLRQVEWTLAQDKHDSPRTKVIRPVPMYREVCEELEKKYGRAQAWRT